jgi:hypothetical protein
LPHLCTISLNYNQYSAIADLHTFQFTVAHALGLSLSTSRLLVTDLNTETITSNHYEVFLTFLQQSLWIVDSLNLTQFYLVCCIPIPLVLVSVLMNAQSQSHSYVTTNGQSASLSWNKAPIWGLRPDVYYCLKTSSLLLSGSCRLVDVGRSL